MSATRLDEIVQMYSNVTGESVASARKKILTTSTGRAIADNNVAYLYDQPTNNLQAITQELGIDCQRMFPKSVIVKAYRSIKRPTIREIIPHEVISIAAAQPDDKRKMQSRLKSQYTAKLKVTQRQRNAILERIQKNAN